jgi:hypothetical protein
VKKELGLLNMCFEESCESPHEAIAKVTALYASYREGSVKKMEEMERTHPELFAHLNTTLARSSVQKREFDILHTLAEREMVTPKVSIALHDHFVEENKTH